MRQNLIRLCAISMVCVAVAVGCHTGPVEVEKREDTAVPQGAMSLLDAKWASGPMAVVEAKSSAPGAAQPLKAVSGRGADQAGRVSEENIPKLPPLPATEFWTTDQTSKPVLNPKDLGKSLPAEQKLPPIPDVPNLTQPAPAGRSK
jgi:hypothetical protein